MRSFWSKLLDELLEGHRAILLYVLQSEGSSPGRQGFKMLVSSSGLLYGSIGGGIMEHKLVEWCKNELLYSGFKPFAKRQIHQSNIKKDKSGMICSGEQTIAFYSMTKNEITTLNEICQAIESEEDKCLEFTERSIAVVDNKIEGKHFLLKSLSTEQWQLLENLNFKPQFYIVGGGHVGLALSKFAKELGFSVMVLDDRVGLNTVALNKYANFIQVSSYEQIAKYIPEGPHFVVLMSFGYRTDKAVLKQLINKEFSYLGMMGSKAKVRVLFQELLEEGYTQEAIDKVYSPIGLPINSKTPEEIAISVLAEVIQLKNR